MSPPVSLAWPHGVLCKNPSHELDLTGILGNLFVINPDILQNVLHGCFHTNNNISAQVDL